MADFDEELDASGLNCPFHPACKQGTQDGKGTVQTTCVEFFIKVSHGYSPVSVRLYNSATLYSNNLQKASTSCEKSAPGRRRDLVAVARPVDDATPQVVDVAHALLLEKGAGVIGTCPLRQ